MSPRVLSVQSHVVSGYVGNKSAVFPLQLLGFDVDPINSVQLCNHTGYKKTAGKIVSDTDLRELTECLADNDLDHYSHLLTGYIGSSSFLYEVSKLVKQLRTKNPNIVYVCDPVMGDNGKMYVPKELIPIYKDFVIPLASIITPNLFELEILTDMKVNSINDIWSAVDVLHKRGCPIVVISSAVVEDNPNLLVFASSTSGEIKKQVLMEIPKLPNSFTGTGDLFTSLFLAWMHKTNNIKDSLEKTIASLQSVLKRTYDSIQGKEVTPKNLELKLIQSKSDIEEPNVIFKATVVNN